ncbi:MAG: alpha-ketoacid dehydrogenase subunit beta [Mariniphaga sp.]|nr:alpha-ketoacid dehydrogenase subunit beta [Mariniphaga sp.]
MSTNRKLSYSLAINEALIQLMEIDNSVFVMGQGVKSPWYVGNTCKDLIKLFGEERVIDTPISENAMTGAAVGASLAGMKPIIMHPRADFALYAFDPIINQAANWSYMNGGQSSAPVVFWLIINRGGEQAAQHSQALHSLFSHIPGLKVIAPSSPYDVKGLLISAIKDPNPVVFIDDRWLYNIEENVPENIYEIPIGKARILNKGTDLTIVSSSFLTTECQKAISKLNNDQIRIELIDLRTIKPLDEDLILNSVKKTGRLIVVDGSWKTNSIASEISAIVNEKAFGYLKSPVARINLPDCPAPAARTLEAVYYINYERIIKTILKIVNC